MFVLWTTRYLYLAEVLTLTLLVRCWILVRMIHNALQWRYTADMNSRHSGTAVVIERKIYFLAYDESVHVYDVDQGTLYQ